MNSRIRYGWALLAAFCVPAFAESFSLAPLPYPHDALQPVIDTKTMQIHHGRHHKAYVDNLNKAVADNAALQGRSLDFLGHLYHLLPQL
jgi:Fe-Mn family superoxide dismutase